MNLFNFSNVSNETSKNLREYFNFNRSNDRDIIIIPVAAKQRSTKEGTK